MNRLAVNNSRKFATGRSGSRTARRQVTLLLSLIAVSLGLMFVDTHHISATKVVKSFFSDAGAPVVEVLTFPVKLTGQTMDKLGDFVSAQKKLAALEEENQRLQTWMQAAMMLESENKRLRTLANVKESLLEYDFVTAPILTDGTGVFAQSLMLSHGQKDGVAKGQGVISKEGLVGRIVDAGTETARVLLVNDMNSRIPVIIEETGDRAILAGNNGEAPHLDHLASHVRLTDGYKVITSGHGGVFPYGIPVGEVKATKNGEFTVSLFANPDKLHFVQIVDYGVDAPKAGRSYASMGF